MAHLEMGALEALENAVQVEQPRAEIEANSLF